MRHRSVSPHHLGWHRLAGVLLAIDIAGIAAVTTASVTVGPRVSWVGAPLQFLILGIVVGLWLLHGLVPGKEKEWALPDTMSAMCCVILAGMWLTPLQYIVAAANRPFVDIWLSTFDQMVGIHVPSLAAWVAARPGVELALGIGYRSLLIQFLFILPIVGIGIRDRQAVWEYAWNFHVAAAVTLLGWALFPAAGAFQFYGFESTIDQTRFIRHLSELRAGTFQMLNMGDVEGLISVPSFHAIGGFILTWAVRRSWKLLTVLVPLNALLVLCTFMSGAHYFADIVAGLSVVGVACATWRKFGLRLLPSRAGTFPDPTDIAGTNDMRPATGETPEGTLAPARLGLRRSLH